ncbi:Integral membrane protein OS=Streptomyces tendae OX=1932 GN=GUR47_13720 PE=4 SV=1 [Streptomyces tendae]
MAELAAHSSGFATFGWEAYHRSDTRRRSRKTIQTVIDLTAFCAVPLAALIVFWANGDAARLLVALSVLEALAVAGLAAQVVWYARRRERPGMEGRAWKRHC